MGLLLLLLSSKKKDLRRSFSTHNKKIVGILKETKNRWECRVPLTPVNIEELKKDWGNQLDFVIQPSRKRIYQDDEYTKVQYGGRESDTFMLYRYITIYIC